MLPGFWFIHIWEAENWRDNASWLVTPCGSSMLATSTLKRAGWWPCSLPCRIQWSRDDPLDVLWPRYLLGLLGLLQHSGSPHLRQWSGKAWQRAMDAGYDNQAAGKVDSLANFRFYFSVSVSCPLSLCRLEILLNPLRHSLCRSKSMKFWVDILRRSCHPLAS